MKQTPHLYFLMHYVSICLWMTSFRFSSACFSLDVDWELHLRPMQYRRRCRQFVVCYHLHYSYCFHPNGCCLLHAYHPLHNFAAIFLECDSILRIRHRNRRLISLSPATSTIQPCLMILLVFNQSVLLSIVLILNDMNLPVVLCCVE